MHDEEHKEDDEFQAAPPPAESVTANKAFTIDRRRLANSTDCLNCGTCLKGPFCYYCGQPDKNLMRFFPALMRDLLEDILDFDSRFTRTIKPLLLHPGKLTRDYLDGRRFRYVAPMRLYIFSSMLFFILAATLAGTAVDIGTAEEGKIIHIGWDSSDTSALQKAVDAGAMSQEEADRVKQEALEKTDSALEANGDVIAFGDEPWDAETNPVAVSWLPGYVNDWINHELAMAVRKGRDIENNPRLIVDKIFEVMPIGVFVMLPLVALLFKIFYMFANKYYVEHLIFSLHNHAFLFVIFLLGVLIDALAIWLDPSETRWISEASDWLTISLLCWIPVYLLVSLKHVYRQGWLMTLGKFSMIGISYLTLLGLLTGIVALLSFILLD